MTTVSSASTVSGIAGFGKRLAHSEKKIRDLAVKSLQEYLIANAEGLSDLDFLKLWKGLFYCYWMSDKPLIQQDLAQKLASTIMTLPVSQAPRYIRSFWKIFLMEWYNIDRLRLDKFYQLCRQFQQWSFRWLHSQHWNTELIAEYLAIMNEGPLSINVGSVPDSLRYHTAEALLQELAKALAAEGVETLPKHAFDSITDPFFQALSRSHNQMLFTRLRSEVLDLWLKDQDEMDEDDDEDAQETTRTTPASVVKSVLSPDQLLDRLHDIISDPATLQCNRRNLIAFNKELAKSMGKTYVATPAVLGGVQGFPETLAPSSSLSSKADKKSKKAKKAAKAAERLSDDADMDQDVNEKETKKSNKRKAAEVEAVDADDAEDEAADEDGSEDVHEPTVADAEDDADDAEGNGDAETNGNDDDDDDDDDDAGEDEAEAEAREAQRASPNKRARLEEAESAEGNGDLDVDASQSSTVEASQERKSVRWGEKLRVKTFFKAKPIAKATDPATPPPKTGTAAKPVLKRAPGTASPVVVLTDDDSSLAANTISNSVSKFANAALANRADRGASGGSKNAKKNKKKKKAAKAAKAAAAAAAAAASQ